MVLVSYSGREINAKLVYYGPGLSGKTTNLEFIYSAIPQTHRGKMVSMKTKTERTLFFDFLPIHLGELSGFKTRFLLYTVPGQVYYNATRKLVLKGVDAIVFVADSKRGKMDENLESLENLRTNLKDHGLSLDEIPWVIQYNKRDLPDVYSIEELERTLNPRKVPSFEAMATTGSGVFETFKAIARMLLKHLSTEIGVRVVPAGAATPRAPAKPQATALAPEPPVTSLQAEDPVPTCESSEPVPVARPEAPGTVDPGVTAGYAEEGADRSIETVHPALGPTQGVGERLRKWFGRSREEADLGLADGERGIEEGVESYPIPDATTFHAAPPEPAAEERDTEPTPSLPDARHSYREVPILVDLEPEDLEVGVVLKLRIAVRRGNEGAMRRHPGIDRQRAA